MTANQSNPVDIVRGRRLFCKF